MFSHLAYQKTFWALTRRTNLSSERTSTCRCERERRTQLRLEQLAYRQDTKVLESSLLTIFILEPSSCHVRVLLVNLKLDILQQLLLSYRHVLVVKTQIVSLSDVSTGLDFLRTHHARGTCTNANDAQLPWTEKQLSFNFVWFFCHNIQLMW